MQNVTAMFLATRKNNVEVVRIMLESHADAAMQCDMVHVVSALKKQLGCGGWGGRWKRPTRK